MANDKKSANTPSSGSANAGSKRAVKNAKAASKVKAAQAQQRQRMAWSIGIIALVVVGIAVLVVAKMSTDGTSTAVDKREPAPASLTKDLATVPIATLAKARTDALKGGSPIKDLVAIDAPALTEDGKPQILYVGAEYCPFCAGERWAVAVALSKFGTFEGLGTTLSAPAPEDPADVPTISFYGSTYTSKYLSFAGRETESRTGKPLDTLTAAEKKILATYNVPPYVAGQGGGIPFIDFGGKFVQSAASYSPSLMSGKKYADIAKEINAGKSDMAKQVNATAGTFIKAICTLTDNQPGDVCKPFAAS